MSSKSLPPDHFHAHESKSRINWFAVSVGLMGLILGYILATQLPATPGIPNQANQAPGTTPTPLPQQPKEPESVQNLPPIDVKSDHIRGNPNASVAVIEYSDFECPFCKRHHSTMKQIMETYSKDVLWIYRHYPLNFHANAQKEEEAVDCAAEQGGNDAFWRFADIIFDKTTSNGTGFPLTELPVAAKTIGLNVDQFQTCLDSGKYADHVKTAMAGGTAAGISGTPGNVIVNRKTQENKLLSGALPFEQFKTVIDGYLK